MANGLLIVAVNRDSTKQLDQFLKKDKTYSAILQFGYISDTYDANGQIMPQNPNIKLTKTQIKKVLKNFIGVQNQIPPSFSAKKIHGKKAYELARAGQMVELKPNQITIKKIKLKSWSVGQNQATIWISCSSGTYIRSLAHDIGKILNCGAYLIGLTRLSIDKYQLKQATNLDDFTPLNWMKYEKKLDY